MNSTYKLITVFLVGIGCLLGMGPWAHAGTSLKGKLEIQHEDNFKDPSKSRYRYFLRDSSGTRHELQFKKNIPHNSGRSIKSGSQIRATGTRSGNILSLDSGTSATNLEVLAAPAPGLQSLGAQNTAVFLINFQDYTNQPWTVAQWNSFMFGTTSPLNSYYLEASYQQTWFTGNVFGWYTLPMNSTDPCDTGKIRTLADAAATAAGVNLSAYSRFVYAIPKSSCGAGGLSSVGGVPSHSYIFASFELRVVAHELGHALGLHHSPAIDCDISPVGNTCNYWEYGDTMDIMGGSAGHFNAFQKENLGWLNYSVSPPITTVQVSGSYSIDPLETVGTRPKALKILKSTDPTTGAKTWYYLEYRQPIGADYGFSTSPSYYPQNLFGGVIVHTGIESDTWSSRMLDMTPGSIQDTFPRADLQDPALTVGQVYSDPAAGMSIAVTSANSTSATVNVTFGTSSSCTRSRPLVTVSPANQTVAAGSNTTFTVTVTNQDSSSCGASTFNLMASNLQNYLNLSFSPSSLALSPGASATTTLTASPKGTSSASMDIIIRAISNSGTPITGSASASLNLGTGGVLCVQNKAFVVVTPDGQGALAGSTLSYTAFVTSRDSSSCPARSYSLQVRFPYGSGLSGTITPSISLNPGATGSVPFTVTSSSSAPTQHNSCTVSVNSSAVDSSYANFSHYVGTIITSCNHTPYAVLLPSLQAAAAGSTLTYTMNVWNSDRSSCGPSTFNLSASVPSGFSASFASNSISLAPGAWTSVPLNVTSPTTAPIDLYTINATASVVGGYGTTTASATYVALGSSQPPTTSCTRANPTLSLSPATATSVAPGTSVTYNVVVTNNDSNACTSSIFNLTSLLPAGFSGSFASSSLTIGPGGSASTTLAVTSPTTATAGSYNLSVKAVNGAATNYTNSATATYSVSTASALSATVSTDKAIYTKSSTAIVTANVSSGGALLAGVSVTFTITKPNGSVVSQSVVTDTRGKAILSFTIGKGKNQVGTYQVRISVSASGQSTSATTSFNVQ